MVTGWKDLRVHYVPPGRTAECTVIIANVLDPPSDRGQLEQLVMDAMRRPRTRGRKWHPAWPAGGVRITAIDVMDRPY